MRISLPAVAQFAFLMIAAAGTSTAAFAQAAPAPNSQDYCLFSSDLYSLGAIICIGRNRALRCDPAQIPGQTPADQTPPARTTHWTLFQTENDGCFLGSTAVPLSPGNGRF